MTPLVFLALWCVVVVQQLYVGQKDREIISVRKMLATVPIEPAHVAKPIVDATDNIVVRFNTLDLNSAAPSNVSVHINHAADASTNTTEAFGRGAPLIYNTAGATEISEYAVGIVVWILALCLCLSFGYVTVTEQTLREKDNENAVLAMEIVRLNNELSHVLEKDKETASDHKNLDNKYESRSKNSTKSGETSSNGAGSGANESPTNDGTSSHSCNENVALSSGLEGQSPGVNEPKDPTTIPTTNSDTGSATKQSRPHGSQSRPVLTSPSNMSSKGSPTNCGPSCAAPNDNSSPSGGPWPEVQCPDDNEPVAPTTAPTTTSDPDSTTESRPHGSQSKPLLTRPSNNVHEDLRRLGVPASPRVPAGPRYMEKNKKKKKRPADTTLGNPNHSVRFIPERQLPRDKSGKNESFPNCPPGPGKPSDQSQPPPSTQGKRGLSGELGLSSLMASKWVDLERK